MQRKLTVFFTTPCKLDVLYLLGFKHDFKASILLIFILLYYEVCYIAILMNNVRCS